MSADPRHIGRLVALGAEDRGAAGPTRGISGIFGREEFLPQSLTEAIIVDGVLLHPPCPPFVDDWSAVGTDA